MREKICVIVGWFACFMAFVLFGSFVDQIRLNMEGQPCSVWIPVSMVINCIGWTSYSLLKEKTDWQMFAANTTGIVVGIICYLTI